MQKKLAIRIAINSASSLLAILLSITIIYLTEYLTLTLDFSLLGITILTVIFNIPFYMIMHYAIAKYISFTISKRLGKDVPTPIKIKLPSSFIIFIFLIPIFTESALFYLFSSLTLGVDVITYYSAFSIILFSKTILLLLKPVLSGKGGGGSGF